MIVYLLINLLFFSSDAGVDPEKIFSTFFGSDRGGGFNMFFGDDDFMPIGNSGGGSIFGRMGPGGMANMVGSGSMGARGHGAGFQQQQQPQATAKQYQIDLNLTLEEIFT